MRVLIVEDQPSVADALSVLFDVHGIPAAVARTPDEALAEVRSGAVGVVVQDMNFKPGATSGREGIDLFHRIRRLDPRVPVLLLTAWASLETAVELVREGAHDYIAKPWNDDKLVGRVRSLLDARGGAPSPPGADEALAGVVVGSEEMAKLFAFAAQVARSDVPVLITGPNGAGKEKIAEVIVAGSSRRKAPFLRVNVGALPDDLLEAELFGAERGAFTGSDRRRVGRFEAAHGGTLFLDEIGTLSPGGQQKLLRALERREFERLGSSETIRVDVRVLAATNADLRAEVAAGRFREDLFFRLNVIEIAVPALRDRPGDILPLASAFLRDHGGGELSPEAEAALLAHGWPGNVRELQNRIRRAQVLRSGTMVTPADLDLSPAGEAAAARDREPSSERSALEALLRRHRGSISRAAEELGTSRQALYRRMDRLGVVLERRPRDD
jgi:DNA-binding NtrC family response regulator